MRLRKIMRQSLLSFVCFALVAASFAWGGNNSQVTNAASYESFASAGNLVINPGFEADEQVTISPTGWQTNARAGTVTTQSSSQSGNYSLKLSATSRTGNYDNPGVGVYQVHTGLEQGTYTMSAWIRTNSPTPDSASQQRAAFLEAKDTGAPPMRAFLNLFGKNKTDWNHVLLRNVIVYNGQATIGIHIQDAIAGMAIEIDNVEFYMEHSDQNPLQNWGFESGNMNGWATTGSVSAITTGVDAGAYAAKLSPGSRISQTVAVEPGKDYIATVRTKVGNGNERIRIGVEGIDESRSAPSATTIYSLVSVAFRTGPEETTATIYVERSNDGTGDGQVDNIDLFQIDQTVVKGVDVSYLLVVEDYGGKYKANGVEQDFFDIARNRGVNAVTSMFFVESGNYIYDEQAWKDYHAGLRDDLVMVTDTMTYTGDLAWVGTVTKPRQMIPGYFGKEQALEIARRAKEHGMKFEVSFHYSDQWMSVGKAWKPLAWFDQNMEQLQTTMYNYTYDFIKTLVDEGLAPDSVKMGNEMNAGYVWPDGKIWSNNKVGFAKLSNASYQAIKDASPNTRGFLHLNNGYDVAYTNSWYTDMENNDVLWDGEAYSLYGGRETGSIVRILSNNLTRWPNKDVIFSETGLAHSTVRYSPMNVSGSMGNSYYETSQRGQYNWLIEYMQALRDVPNPHNAQIGFFYWAAEWLSKGDGHDDWFTPWIPGGSTTEIGNTVDNRTLFTYDGHVMDGMYAYLWRGKASIKPSTAQVSHNSVASYAVEPTAVTGVELEESTLELIAGESERLVATVQPADQFTYSNLVWKSSNEAVAIVNKQGIVTAVGQGTTTITVTTKEGNYSDSRNVVVAVPVLAAGVSLTMPAIAEELSAVVGERILLKAKISNSDAKDQRIVFTSSDPNVASFLGEAAETSRAGELIQQTNVTDSVTLLAHRDGNTQITITSADGNAQQIIELNVSRIPVEGIAISPGDATLSLGRTLQLTADVNPENASFPEVNWSTSNASVAIVSENGLVTGVTEGSTTITATSIDSGLTDRITITVVPVQSKEITLNLSSVRMRQGDTETLTATVLPVDTANKELIWSIEDTSVVTVNDSGLLTALQNGTTNLTVTAKDGGASVSIPIVVADEIRVTGITVTPSSASLIAGQWQQLEVAVVPSTADNTKVTWHSSDSDVADVDKSGLVLTKKAGSVQITTKSEDGGFSAVSAITVTDLLSLNKSITATRAGGSNPARYAVDGQESTAWSSGGAHAGEKLTVDLGQTALIDRTALVSWTPQDYTIEVSEDGTNFITVITRNDMVSAASSSVRMATTDDVPDQVLGRYIRLTITKIYPGQWTGVREFQVFGRFLVPAESIAIQGAPSSLIIGDNATLQATVTPNYADTSLTWSSSDPTVISVDQNGHVTAAMLEGNQGEVIGSAVITARASNGIEQSVEIGVKYPIIVEDIMLYRKDEVEIPENRKVSLDAGKTLELGIGIFQSTAHYKPVYWTSSDSSVATVNEHGIVTAHQPGTTSIKVNVDSYSNIPGGFLFTREIELTVNSANSGGEEPEKLGGKGSVSGPSEAYIGQTLDLTLGLSSLTGGFSTLDVVLNYDPLKVAFDTVDHEGTISLSEAAWSVLNDNAMQVLGTAVKPEQGQLRIIMAKTGAPVTEAGEFLTLHAKILENAESGQLNISLSDYEVSFESESALVDVIDARLDIDVKRTDKTMLGERIGEAQLLYDNTLEGNAPGQYPAAARAAFHAAIQAVVGVTGNPTASQAEIDSAVTALSNAVRAYQDAVIQRQDVPVDKTTLQAAIGIAQAKLNRSVAGNKVGQHPQAARDMLTAAIQTAQSVQGSGSATQEQVNQATQTLNEAVQTFASKIVTLVGGTGKVTIKDLSIVAKYYGATEEDANWNEIAQADLLEQGRIDIVTLAAIAQMILDEWLNE